jgi:hypothetical protein
MGVIAFGLGQAVEALVELKVRKVLGCLEYIHYAILILADTKDILDLSDAMPKVKKAPSWPRSWVNFRLS